MNAASDANYRLDLVKLTVVSSTDLQVAEVFEGDTVAVLGNRTQQVAGTWGSGCYRLRRGIILRHRCDQPRYRRICTCRTRYWRQRKPPRPRTDSSSLRARPATTKTLRLARIIYRNLQNGARAEIVFEIEVARALQIEENGRHVITSPNSIDFREPFDVTLEAGVANLRVALRNSYVQDDVALNGVLYIVVDAVCGTGYTVHTHGSNSRVAGVEVAQRLLRLSQGGSVTRIAVHERGINYSSAPTVTRSRAAAEAAQRQHRLSQATTPRWNRTLRTMTPSVGMATAHFDLEQAFTESERNFTCQISYNSKT